MGGVCEANRQGKEKIQCPHKKRNRRSARHGHISQDISQKQTCQICQRKKELKQIKTQENILNLKAHLSLSSHNFEDSPKNFEKQRSSKIYKKSLDDFEVVRGLGKGAFGKVFMIKERQDTKREDVQANILSLTSEQIDNYCKQTEIQEDVEISFIMDIKEDMDPSQMFKKQSKKKSAVSTKNNEDQPRFYSLKRNTSKNFNPRYFALKIINKNRLNTKKDVEHTMSERYILQAIEHPFIVKLHYAFQTQSRLFLIVDLLAGGELFYLLRKRKRFDEKTAKFYAAQILLALEYLHKRSIIYRDLKPENILLDEEGHAKLTDFGLSKILYSENQKAYSLCGTPQYMSPDVILGMGYTMAADWFSFGSLIYDMLTGRPPFLNNNKKAMLKNLVTKPVPLPYYISEEAKSLLRGLFQIRPEDRLGSKGAIQIKNHAFFKDIDFDKLLKREIEPPFNFKDAIKKHEEEKGKDQKLNNSGFEPWTSWQGNVESSDHENKENIKSPFDGFTFEQQSEYEMAEEKEAFECLNL